MSFHVLISPVLSAEEGIGWIGFYVRRLMVTLGQLVGSIPRTGRNVAAPWFFNQKYPLRLPVGG